MSMARGKIDPHRIARLAASAAVASPPHGKIPVRMPFSGDLLGDLPAGGEPDVARAVALARAAQPAWHAAGISARSRILLRFHDLLLERQDEALDLIQLEIGKARRHAFEEILDTAIVARYYALHAAGFLRARRHKGALPILTRTLELRHPLGVIGFLSPWNFPLTLGITDALPALMAGNACVLKPDPQAAFTALWALDLLRESGLPRDVLHVVTGEGALLGPALTAHADYIMFTGSGRVGRTVGQQAAERLIGCSLELGGKNPMLVLADAALASAVEGAVRGCFCGAGQVCVSIERIYVHESLFDAFLARFCERTRSMKLGAALDYSADMGSLATARQLASVEAHVADAVSKGAAVAAGGRPRPDLGPLFYEPTILTGVRPQMQVFAEETFGPVVSVYPFRGEDEAVELANAGRYGLSAAIWSRNTRCAMRLARRIRTGNVNINEAYAAAWGSVDSPIGGMKESGLHPRHGAEGILKYTAGQTVAAQHLIPIAPFGPVDAAMYARWMTRLVRLIKTTRFLG